MLEEHLKLPFFNVLYARKDNDVITAVYKEGKSNDLCLKCKSFAPKGWNRWAIKTILERADLILSAKQVRRQKIKYMKEVKKYFVDNSIF